MKHLIPVIGMAGSCRVLMLCLCLFASIGTFAYRACIDGIYYNFSGNDIYQIILVLWLFPAALPI